MDSIYDENNLELLDKLASDSLEINTPNKSNQPISQNKAKLIMHHIDCAADMSIKTLSKLIEDNLFSDFEFDDNKCKQTTIVFDFCFNTPEYSKYQDIIGFCFKNWLISTYSNLSKVNPKIFSILFRGVWDNQLFELVVDEKIAEMGITIMVKSDIIYVGSEKKKIDLQQYILTHKFKNIVLA